MKQLDKANNVEQFDINVVDPQIGLTQKQQELSFLHYGKNVLKSKKNTPLLIRFLKHLVEPMIILLLLAAFIALGVGIYQAQTLANNQEAWTEVIINFVEAVVIFFIVFLNAFFGLYQENKAEKAMENLKKLTSPYATVIREGQIITISSSEVLYGDILLIESGNQIPADGLILENNNLEVNESILTGESEIVKKDNKQAYAKDLPLAEQKNRVFSGTTVIYGNAKILVDAIANDSEIGKINKLIAENHNTLSPLQSKINRLSKIIGIIAAFLCVVTFFVYMLVVANVISTPKNWQYWNTGLITAITLAIGTIPEGLVPIITVILSFGVKRMSKKNALVKKISSVESLGSAAIICSDKTGTLTQNKMTITKLWSISHQDFITDFQTPASQNLLTLANLCTDAHYYYDNDNNLQEIGDPTEIAIVKLAYENKIFKEQLLEQYQRVFEIPFDSDRKLMTTVYHHKKTNQYISITKGAWDTIAQKLTQKDLTDAQNAHDQMANNALRVLAVAIKTLPSLETDNLENELELIGLMGMIDPPRPEAINAIKQAQAAGIRTIMITGDNAKTAQAIAKELNIIDSDQKVISGQMLNAMKDQELDQNIAQYSVYARVSPSDKIRIVKAWQKQNKIVAMTGDGVNDAPALKAADIGCAMGITGTDVSKEAADIIITDDNFATIVSAVKEGRRLLDTIKRLMVFLFATNLAAMIVTFFGILIFGINPLSALQILWINVVSETFPGIAFGLRASNDKKLMLNTPMNKNQKIVSKQMLLSFVALGSFASIATLLMFYIGASSYYDYNFMVMRNALSQIHQNAQANYSLEANLFGSTLAFLTLSFCLTVNSVVIKSKYSVFKEKWFNNKPIIIGLILSIFTTLIVLLIPYMNFFFNLLPYFAMHLLKESTHNSAQYLLAFPFIIAFSLFIITEFYKIITNRK